MPEFHPERASRRTRRGGLETSVRPDSVSRVVASVQTVRNDSANDYTMWMQDYPDFPMPGRLRSDRTEGRVTISCQLRDIDFSWQLAEDGPGTRIRVHVTLPESEAHGWMTHEMITTSLAQLATVAKATANS